MRVRAIPPEIRDVGREVRYERWQSARRDVGTVAGSAVPGYDVARAVAMWGMIVTHFGVCMAADFKEQSPAAVVMRVLDGRAAATFVVLAGVGVSLMAAGRQSHRAPLASACRRGLAPARRGVRLNLLVWKGDILRVYGVSLVVAAALLV